MSERVWKIHREAEDELESMKNMLANKVKSGEWTEEFLDRTMQRTFHVGFFAGDQHGRQYGGS